MGELGREIVVAELPRAYADEWLAPYGR